jgi:hypothetical protein
MGMKCAVIEDLRKPLAHAVNLPSVTGRQSHSRQMPELARRPLLKSYPAYSLQIVRL